MYKIRIPGGGTAIHMGSEQEARERQALIDARHAFILAYTEKKGWDSDPEKLSIEQILEIRAQPGWKNPLVDSE